MFVVTVLVLLGAGLAANSEIHSLTYICTALSKSDGTPGIHRFASMGLLDGRMIEFYDSESERKVPKQEWMREHLPADYWDKGTEEPWLENLMNRMRQNDSVVHVFQGMRGCEGEMQPDGTLKFHHAMHTYARDGDDLLSFNYKKESWIAPITEAQLTMREWDSNQAMKEHIKRYLENECIDRLKIFWDYRKKQLQEAPPPEVFVFAKKAKVQTNLILTCLATGFYPKDIIMRIRRNGRVLTADDGLTSSGVLPNNDETFQRRESVEILKSDLSKFSCEVVHKATEVNVAKTWRIGDHEGEPEPGPGSLIPAAGGILVVVFAVAACLIYLYKKGILGGKRGANSNQAQPSLFPPPDRPQVRSAQVEVYAQDSNDGEKILLTCIARGQGVIDVKIKRKEERREEETVTEEKGLMRNNKDGSLEIRAHVEIKDDKSKYSYEVIYAAPKNPTVNTFACALPWRGPPEVQWRWTEIHNLEDYLGPDLSNT